MDNVIQFPKKHKKGLYIDQSGKLAGTPLPTSLKLNDDDSFEQRMWRIQESLKRINQLMADMALQRVKSQERDNAD